MANSRNLLIPHPLLIQTVPRGGFPARVESGSVDIGLIKPNPREGWASDSRRIAQAGDDKLVLAEVSNEGDEKLTW